MTSLHVFLMKNGMRKIFFWLKPNLCNRLERTSSKRMASVETNSNSGLVLNAVDDPTQLQEASANGSNLTRHVFQHYSRH